MMFASKTPRDLNRDPYPYVWEGHTPHNQMRADTDMFRKGAPFDWVTYPHRPRPEYDHPQHNEPNPILVELRRAMTTEGGKAAGLAHKARLFLANMAPDKGWSTHGHLFGFAPAHIDHARRVLTRLAHFTEQEAPA